MSAPGSVGVAAGRKLVIVGDSAFAQVARQYFEHDSPYRPVAFSVERAFLKRDQLDGLPVVPFEDLQRSHPPAGHDVFVAIVYTQLNRLRTRLMEAARALGFGLAGYRSSRAFIWPNVEIGEHCFVFEDNTLQPYAQVGRNVVLWSGNHIGHHAKIGDHCFVASQVVISGFCEIGESSFLGVNATIANNVRVAQDNWIGPGTIVMQDTQPGALFHAKGAEPSKVSAPRFFKLGR